MGLALALAASAQVERLAKDVHYDVELSAQTSNGDQAPFWFVAGRYGLSSAKPSSGYLRAAVGRRCGHARFFLHQPTLRRLSV